MAASEDAEAPMSGAGTYGRASGAGADNGALPRGEPSPPGLMDEGEEEDTRVVDDGAATALAQLSPNLRSVLPNLDLVREFGSGHHTHSGHQRRRAAIRHRTGHLAEIHRKDSDSDSDAGRAARDDDDAGSDDLGPGPRIPVLGVEDPAGTASHSDAPAGSASHSDARSLPAASPLPISDATDGVGRERRSSVGSGGDDQSGVHRSSSSRRSGRRRGSRARRSSGANASQVRGGGSGSGARGHAHSVTPHRYRMHYEQRQELTAVTLRIADPNLRPLQSMFRRGTLLLDVPASHTLEFIIDLALEDMVARRGITNDSRIEALKVLAGNHSTITVPAVVIVLAMIDSIDETHSALVRLDSPSNLGVGNMLARFVVVVLSSSNPGHGTTMAPVKAKSMRAIKNSPQHRGLASGVALSDVAVDAAGDERSGTSPPGLPPLSLGGTGPSPTPVDDASAAALSEVVADADAVVETRGFGESTGGRPPLSARSRKGRPPVPKGGSVIDRLKREAGVEGPVPHAGSSDVRSYRAMSEVTDGATTDDDSEAETDADMMLEAVDGDPSALPSSGVAGGLSSRPYSPFVDTAGAPARKPRSKRELQYQQRWTSFKVLSADERASISRAGQMEFARFVGTVLMEDQFRHELQEAETRREAFDAWLQLKQRVRQHTEYLVHDNEYTSAAVRHRRNAHFMFQFKHLALESGVMTPSAALAGRQRSKTISAAPPGLAAPPIARSRSGGSAVGGRGIAEAPGAGSGLTDVRGPDVETGSRSLSADHADGIKGPLDQLATKFATERDRRTMGLRIRRPDIGEDGDASHSGNDVSDSDEQADWDEEYVPHEIDGLVWTRRVCGGLRSDLRRRLLPHWISDWKDGLTPRIAGPVFYLYIATVVPTIAFGGLLEKVTNDQVGTVETFLAQAVMGVVFALVGGQGLSILRTTGPVVAFIQIIFANAEWLEVPFLHLYAWTGLFAALWLLLCAFTDASVLISLLTDFVEDVFGAIIATIFLVEAVGHAQVYLRDGQYETVAVLSLSLMLLTHVVCLGASKFNKSRFLTESVRELITVTAPLIAMVVTTAVAWLTHGRFWDTPAIGSLWLLDVPNQVLEPTQRIVNATAAEAAALGYVCSTDACGAAARPWLVPFWESNQASTAFAALILGLLLAILLFLEQNVTAALLMKPSNMLLKGSSFHWDLFVVAVLVAVLPMFGLPVGYASLPHSLIHLHAHAVADDSGELDERGAHQDILDVNDNRTSALVVSVLVGATLFVLPVLSVVPLPVIFGLFLFFAFDSLSNNPMLERVSLMFTQPALYPPGHLVRQLPPVTVHAFTIVQLLCLAAVWTVKAIPSVSALFPVVMIAMVPLRLKVLPKLFGEPVIQQLDEQFDEDDEHHVTHAEEARRMA